MTVNINISRCPDQPHEKVVKVATIDRDREGNVVTQHAPIVLTEKPQTFCLHADNELRVYEVKA